MQEEEEEGDGDDSNVLEQAEEEYSCAEGNLQESTEDSYLFYIPKKRRRTQRYKSKAKRTPRILVRQEKTTPI